MNEVQLKKVLITGPTGAVGVSLIQELIGRGIAVTAVCRPASKRLSSVPKHPLVEIVECGVDDLLSLEERLPKDYDAFYQQEICLRKLRNSPPYTDLTVITVSGTDGSAVLRACNKMRGGLEQGMPSGQISLLGPAPAVVAKVNNHYRYQLTLIGRSTPELRHLVASLLRAVHQDKDIKGVSAYADINPMD